MKWDNRSKLLKISTYAIIICAVLTLLIAGFTIYGDKVGNFVVSVDKKSEISLALSDKEDLSEETARLAVKGIEEMRLSSLSDVPRTITEGMGSKNSATGHYLAYSFYLINHTNRAIDYAIDITVVESTHNVDSVARIMLIENEAPRGEIYAKPNDDGTPKDHSDLDGLGFEPYTTTPFVSDKRVLSKDVTDFASGSHVKYTVILWLEGNDPKATDEIKGGSFRVTMNFRGY